jgi:RNA polymerase sigma-70 factor (ECF subfamily)
MMFMQADPRVQVTEFPDSEDELICLAQNGDREAFCELVRRFRVGVIDVVYRMCGNSDVAEDAAQQTFLSAWRSLGSFRPQTSFRSWLYRIAINAAVDILRREQPAVDIELLPLAAPGNGLQAQVERRERAQRVRQAVLALPEAGRAVLILREYQNLSYAEIAAALDIPIGTVMSRLNYARQLLAERLKRELEAE